MKERPKISAARSAAFAILREVERGQAHSDALLRAHKVTRLSEADRNLTTALVLDTLRWQLWLDEQVRPLLKRPNGKLDFEVKLALRLGALQILRMDRIPARAAIDESVELTKQSGHKFGAGMVNAVLRKLAERGVEGDASDAAVAAYPAWMTERWARFFGDEAMRAICEHGQTQAATTLRLVAAEAEGELAAAGVATEPGALLTAARHVTAGDATAVLADVRVRLQDEGSQLVAEIAGRGAAILDCCAAPGGKTLILAERNPAARIVAQEASEARLGPLKKRLTTAGARVECRLGDASALGEDAAYDVVLADVPCSGTGTLGRNPEIRHRLREPELVRQAERQRAILRGALRAVKPGGRVVYSTCSLEPEENEEVVAAVIAENAHARVTPVDERVAAMRADGVLTAEGAEKLTACATSEGYLRLLPGVVGTDGFFVAVLTRA
ncbi:MAG: transcription antitermination factor NusB [Terracidiphilus sp.]|nr:transcription antitermination factor NusB [Terracidiphilus sp.]